MKHTKKSIQAWALLIPSHFRTTLDRGSRPKVLRHGRLASDVIKRRVSMFRVWFDHATANSKFEISSLNSLHHQIHLTSILFRRVMDCKACWTEGAKGTVTEGSHLPQGSRQGNSSRQHLLHLQQPEIVKVRLSQYSRNSGPQDILSMQSHQTLSWFSMLLWHSCMEIKSIHCTAFGESQKRWKLAVK